LRLFEDQVLWKMFRPNKDGVIREFVTLNNEEILGLSRPLKVNGKVKCRRLLCAGYVARLKI